MAVWGPIGHALAVAGSMTWQVTWSLILGFTLAAVIQALVRKSTIVRLMPDDRPRSLATASALGAASSSCSYAAVALAYVATTEQVWVLHDAMPEHLRAAILLGAFAGLRVAEACGLRVSDVDFLRGVISPIVQYPAEPLKTETSRTAIPIPRSLCTALSVHVARWRGEHLLIGESGGSGWQLGPWVLERAVRVARGKVEGLPDGFRYHDLRHYLASLLIASGANIKVVQARLRHASAVTTLDTYGHLWPDADEATRTAVEAVLVARADSLRTQEVIV